jgi:hypothetical protein
VHQEKAPENHSPQTQEAYARSIVHESDFVEAITHLRNEGVLQEQILLTKEKYQKALESAEFLTEKDWELLTFITLYSPELATHSVETYQLVRSKIEHIFLGSETIAQSILKENASLDEFYRACILHDIGKTHIPESVLNYILQPGDWHALINILTDETLKHNIREYLGIERGTHMEQHELISHLMDSNIDPITVLPVRRLLTEEQLSELERRGISRDLTLRQVHKLHEPASQKILELEGFPTEARIAGQHHNYNKETYHFPISSQTVGINADLADLLHLADGEQAMLSERAYKPAFSRLEAFKYLIKDAKKGAVNKELTALWVQHDIEKGLVVPVSEKDEEVLKYINAFLEEYLPKK